MTYILAIDTTLGACSSALLKDGKIISHRQEIRNRGHVERLLPMIGEVCGEAAIDLSALNYIVPTVGPGTFAGVRIGLSAAKGMALALDIPIIPITTLEAIAYAYAVQNEDYSGRLAIAIDARRNEIYLQSFEINRGVIAPLNVAQAVPIEGVEEKLAKDVTTVIGSGCSLFSILKIDAVEGHNHPNASYIAQLGEMCLDRAQNCDNISPLYLRKPDAKLPSAVTVAISDA